MPKDFHKASELELHFWTSQVSLFDFYSFMLSRFLAFAFLAVTVTVVFSPVFLWLALSLSRALSMHRRGVFALSLSFYLNNNPKLLYRSY